MLSLVFNNGCNEIYVLQFDPSEFWKTYLNQEMLVFIELSDTNSKNHHRVKILFRLVINGILIKKENQGIHH